MTSQYKEKRRMNKSEKNKTINNIRNEFKANYAF